MINVYEAQEANKTKSLIVMALFVVFVTVATFVISWAFGIMAGYEPSGLGFAGFALILSGLMSIGSYYFSDRIVLSISGAKPASRREHFNFYTVAQNLAIASQTPMPKLYVIEDTAPNAFATGRDPEHAVVCATTGLLQKLNRSELEGVIAHELSHVKNFDTRLMSIVAVLVGMIALLADMFLRASFYGRGNNDRRENQLGAILLVLGIVFAILSPIIAQLIQLAISRRREFLADAGSVFLTRQPSGLISALKKISSDHESLEVANKATAHLYIVNPFHVDREKGVYPERRRGAVGWFANLFNTHPPISERITALSKMA